MPPAENSDRKGYALVNRLTHERLDYIDGLRAIAVLLVVLHHATLHSSLYLKQHVVSPWMHVVLEGEHGVDLFFVLSGFCLSYPTLARLHRFGTAAFRLHTFAARRLLRIVPPYYAAIAFCVVLSAVPGFGGMLSSWPDIVRQALFLDWHTQFLNRSFWTLCIEFRWYFIFPAALALWVYSRRLFFAVAAVCLTAYLTTRLRSIDLGVLLPFLLGITAAHCYINPRPWFKYFAVAAPAGVLLGIILEPLLVASSFGVDAIPLAFIRTNVGWQFAMFSFVVLCGYSTVAQRLLSLRPLVWIGVASYSIYLIHEPLVQRVDDALPQSIFTDYVACVAISVACGFVFWFIAERPWVYGALRRWSLPQLEAALGWLLSRLDVPESLLFPTQVMPIGQLREAVKEDEVSAA